MGEQALNEMLENEHLKKQHAAQIKQLEQKLQKEVSIRKILEEATEKKEKEHEQQLGELKKENSDLKIDLNYAKGNFKIFTEIYF